MQLISPDLHSGRSRPRKRGMINTASRSESTRCEQSIARTVCRIADFVRAVSYKASPQPPTRESKEET